jgi:hypothetical protein
VKNLTALAFMTAWTTLSILFFLSCYEGKVDPPTGEEQQADATDGNAPAGDTSDDDEGDDNGNDQTDLASSDCDNAFSFNTDIVGISSEKCDSCHPSLSPPNTTLKSDWSSEISEIVKRLKGEGSLMPQGGPALSASEIAGIELWADCNFPD